MKRRLTTDGSTTEHELAEAVYDYRMELEGLRSVNSSVINTQDAMAAAYLRKRIVPTVGRVPKDRSPGTWRWLCGNVNGLATTKSQNFKAEQLRNIVEKYKPNGFAFCEVGLDSRCFKASETIPTFLKLEGNHRTAYAHNKYKPKVGLAQQGGCVVIAMGETCQYAKVTKGSSDWRKLGRWDSMVLSSHPNQKFRMVSAYNVGRPKPQGIRTVYQQTIQYCQQEDIASTPRKLMRDDLTDQLKIWLRQGERIMLYMDANENVINGALCRKLADLGFTPWGHRLHGTIPNTHVEGRECIDEVWASYGVEVTGIQFLSFHESVGDHRSILVDFTTRSTIGLFAHLIVRPECRRLVNTNQACGERYRELVEKQWLRHRINERLERIEEAKLSYPISEEVKTAMRRIDVQIGEIFNHGENNCRKIRNIDGEYSLPAKYWHEKAVSIKALKRRLEGKTSNDGNICRTARRHELAHPRRLDMKQLDDMYKIAIARKRTLKTQARFLRQEHLRERRALAVNSKNEEKVSAIDSIIKREKDKNMWKRINKVVRPPHPGALMRVERETDEGVVEFTEEKELVDNILEVIQDRFSGAEDAPISNCSLTEDLGDFGFTELGLKIISGEFQAPEDLHEATARILDAIGKIGEKHKDDNVDISLSAEQYSSIWHKAKERTSSSMSKRHFGHYIACADSELLSKGLAMQISLIARMGCPPERWHNVLMVMLEKKLGIVLIPKLRAILLKEADNNMHDGYLFGGRLLSHARECGLIPQEQLAEKDKTAEDGVFAKVLKADYARLRRIFFGQISADAANCYDLVNHLILALLLHAMGMPMGPIFAMLYTIMFMRYYLRTGFGESQSYMGGELAPRRMHGLNQGSRSAPPCWNMLSSLLVEIQRARGHVATVISPITMIISRIVGSLYVDDTDLFVMDELWLLTRDIFVEEAQSSLNHWGHGLIGGGGGCKPVKCWAYLIEYRWDDYGQWYCDSLVDGYSLTVPTANGNEEIELCDAYKSQETLGVFTNPGGTSRAHFDKVIDKVRTWTARIQSGHLPVAFNWTSYIFQLWTSVRYGIGALPTDRNEVEGILDDTNRDILASLGVNRNIRTGWRTLHRSFLGIGLFNFEVELMIQRINLFLQHYDSPYDIGITLRATMESVQLEAGFTDCPLLHPFHPHGTFVTHCWFRSFWQALDYFGMKLFIDYPGIQTPRERDQVLVTVYASSGWDTSYQYYQSWNRCRLACKALFLSDITTADGKYIDGRFLSAQVIDDPPLSAYQFAQERPCEADWAIWIRFWQDFTYPGFVLVTSLGPWVCSSHRPNEWYIDESTQSLFRRTAGGGQLFSRAEATGRLSRSSQRFRRLGPVPSIPDLTDYVPCNVTRIDEDYVILGATGPPRYDPPPIEYDLLSLLRSWGGEWMWESIEVTGSLDSVVTAVQNGTAIWCTDGSFDRVMMPDISSAGWVVFDPLTKHHLHGSFFEVSGEDAASAYRGELLGLTALHLVAVAINELYGDTAAPNKLFCDNERALGTAKWTGRRISPGTKHGDLLRLLRNIKPLLEKMFTYHHIYGHADKHKRWAELSLIEKLNCYCDQLAGTGRRRSAGHNREISTQVLPKERAALFLQSVKQTGDISVPARFFLGFTEARAFYIEELNWSAEQFDEVDWVALNFTLQQKNMMYTLWLAKQASSFCGTRLQVSRMTPGADDRCPNCLAPEERSTHLNLCPSLHRTLQFRESVADLQKWLNKEHTHPELAFWIPKYLLARNRCSFQDLPNYLPKFMGGVFSSQMRAIAIAQDSIGWTHFLEGKITGQFRAMQQRYLRSTPARINGRDWTKVFISKLIKISHTQWIFRNMTLHDRQFGHLAQLKREELAQEIEQLHALDPSQIPEESRFLLDFDVDDLAEGDIANQEHWIIAVKAARIAGMRKQRRSLRWKALRKKKRKRRDPPTRVFATEPLAVTLQRDLLPELPPPSNKRCPSEGSLSLLEPSNKRRRRRRKLTMDTPSPNT